MRTRLPYLALVFILCGLGGGVGSSTVIVGQEPDPRVPTAAPPDAPAPGGRSPRNANYDIDVRLDHAARTLTGRETIRWRNISRNDASELQFHLYWNAWRNADSTWLRERTLVGFPPRRTDAWGSVDVTAIRQREASGAVIDLMPTVRFIAPDDGNALDRTVLSVPLPRSVAPGETIEVDVEWTSKVPRPFSRTGYVDDYYFIAQWFPKLGVLEDTGWNTHQFHSGTEFFADYGVYDVRLRLPRAFVVGASGREVSKVTNTDNTTTHRYRGEDIHDFAWTASPRFVDARRMFEHATLPPVEMRLLLQPERRDQAERYFTITAATLKRYGEWFGAYPYGYVTIVDPAFQGQSDGMEYPTLFTGRSRWLAPATVQMPESTTSHEAGHQWWYGMVASNEFEHAWMDEGLNTFATARVLDEAFNPNRVELRYFGGFIPWVFRDIPFTRIDNDRLAGYRPSADSDAPATPTWRYWPGTGAFISYNKTALWLHTLERHLGWPVLQRILAAYFERWAFRHPGPEDFFRVVNEVSGRDMTWFFDQVYRSSNVFDYGVQTLSTTRVDGAVRTTVVVRRFGEATFPVEVVTTFGDGTEARERWDGLDRRAIYTYTRPAGAVSVVVDPERVLLLDVNYTNNSRTVAPRAREAGLKWSAKWLVWLQDLMLTYGFFV